MAGQVRDALAAPRRGVVGFFRGLTLPFRGARIVYLEQPDLMRYWAVPIVVTAATLVLALFLVFHYDDALVDWVWTDPGAADDWQGWLLGAAHGVFGLLVDLLLVVLALLGTLIVSSLVAAPFNARLAEVVDERLHAVRPLPFGLGSIARDVARTAVIEVVFAVVNAVLFVLGLAVPVAGPVLFVLGMIAWALYFAIAYVEVPLATRGKSLGERFALVGRHPMAMLGFGTGVGLFLIVPIVNLLFMPAAVAGGVLLVGALTAEEPSGATT